MRNAFVILSLTGSLLFSGITFAMNNKELPGNVKIVQPTQSKYSPQTLIIDRFVLADNSEVSYNRLANSVARRLGSDNANVNIVWTNKTNAERVRSDLIKKGVKKDKINLVRNNQQQDIYSVYVEIERISAKRTKCRVDTAEDMMSFDPYNPCATKSNERIQLKY